MLFVTLLLLLTLSTSDAACSAPGFSVGTDDDGDDICFCPFGYSGSICTTGPFVPSLEDDNYPCDPNAETDDPTSCTQFLSSVNLYTADPLTKRVCYSNIDDQEFGRLTEPVNPLNQLQMMITISEHEVIYIETLVVGGGYNSKIIKYDYRTEERTDLVTLAEGATYAPVAMRKSRFSDHFYLVQRFSIEKYDFEGTKVKDIDTVSSSIRNIDVAQVPGATTQDLKEKLFFLGSDGRVYYVCDDDYTSSCSFSGRPTPFSYTVYWDYISSDPSALVLLPDKSGVLDFTVVIAAQNDAPWVTNGGALIGDFMSQIPSSVVMDTREAYYDEGRDIVFFGEYSFGTPRGLTSNGVYLGTVGPDPGYHASSTALSIRPGPYSRLSTYTTPSTVIAGTSLDVVIVTKDYLGAVWTKDSSGNLEMKAYGTASSGAALTYDGSIAQVESETGTYRGSVVFEEAGGYTVGVTEGPGKQKLLSTDRSAELQAVTVKAAVTAAKQSQLIISSTCANLVAGSSCLIEVAPKDEFGNAKDDIDVEEVFMISVYDSVGFPAFNTSTPMPFVSTVSLIKYGLLGSNLKNSAAKYIVEVTKGGVMIAGSPAQIEIVPGNFNVDKASVDAETRGEYDPSDETQEFEISLYDSYDNFISAKQSHLDSLEVKWYRPTPEMPESGGDEITETFTNFTSSVSQSGSILVQFVDPSSATRHLSVRVSFSSQSVVNPDTDQPRFDIVYSRSLVISKGLRTDTIIAIAFSVVVFAAIAGLLLYRERLKNNKLKATMKATKFTAEEMRLLEVIMAKSSFGDELTESTHLSKDITIEKRLGMGAFGEVFLGKFGSEVVAIKTLKQISESNVTRFRGEMLLTKQLNHPNIVQYIGCVWDTEMIGLMLEFVSGGDLSGLLQNNETLTWQSPKHMQATDIANAMVYLHSTRYWEEEKQEWQKCVIHRDLKPDNMLVTADTFNVKLTDFGEARARKPDKTMTQVGTPIFIAPEVMKGDRYDERCDVFSFAICLVDMLQITPNIVELFAEAYITYKETDTGLSLVAITHCVVMEGLRPTLPDDIPASLGELIRDCWDGNPEGRPHFSEILDRLMFEVKADVFGLPLDEKEAKERKEGRMQRLESVRNTEREEGGMFVGVADTKTRRIESLQKEREESLEMVKRLEDEVGVWKGKYEKLKGVGVGEGFWMEF
ncbi:hypothetical protein TL16_g00668 [Triparma laevis f. inornata]|uniref:Protein kinase domain-containing protein n=1 Tax=Triparma laevis f. inornata TaxID=1714386 RepID=A0A9W7DNY7_9STRA|nr:hypothetical protein TL16_g00668 [Triparma laevis f. inornata]